MADWLDNLPTLSALRLADALDVLVVATLLYGVLSWLRRRGSQAIGFALLAIALLYVAAHQLNMYLTLMLFRVGITGLLLALLLIFQSDIRRGVERLVSSPVLRRRAKPSSLSAETNEALVEAAARLAEQKVGALVALAGREPLDPHVRGGIPLDGVLSVPLLLSVFHPATRGHDGAVLIEQGRIRHFAAHLPLSSDLSQLQGSGTRHAAALGLSERCDALVIVVSEERGSVGLAENGRLDLNVPTADLSARLQNFSDTHAPETTSSWRRIPFRNPSLKAAALLLAIGFWWLGAYRADIVQRVFHDVPVEYRNLPAHWSVVDLQPSNVRLTLTGRERAFADFEFEQLIVSLNLANVRDGEQEIPVTAEMLGLPDDIALRSTDRPVIRLTAYPMTTVTVPVRPRLSEPLPEGWTVSSVRSEPAQLRLIVRHQDRELVTVVETEPMVVRTLSAPRTTFDAPLKLPPFAQPADGAPATVRVILEARRTSPPANARDTANAPAAFATEDLLP